MKVTTEQLEHCRVVLEVEVEQERLGKAADKALQKLSSRVHVPGFRPGKAPRQILRNFVGETRVRQETLQAILPDVYSEAVKESGIKPFGEPDFEIVRLDASEPLVFKATVPVEPVVTLGSYRDITVSPEPVDVPEADIERSVDSTRSSYARWEPVTRPAAMGDRITVNYTGALQGRVLEQRDGREIELGKGLLPGAVELALVGAEAGQQRVANAEPSVPDAPVDDGPGAVYTVDVLEVKEKIPPTDDELLAQLDGIETIEALRERIANNLRHSRAVAEDNRQERAALDELQRVSTVEFPSVMVDSRVESLLETEIRRFAVSRLSLEQMLQAQGLSLQQYAASLRPDAERRVRDDLLLEAVADAERIEVDEAKVQEIVSATSTMVNSHQYSPAVLERTARRSARRRKALTWLVRQAGGQLSIEADTSVHGTAATPTEVVAGHHDDAVELEQQPASIEPSMDPATSTQNTEE